MAKQITFTYDGDDYVLEYTRRSIQRMEQNGFIADDIDKKPATLMPRLFAGAFIAHHRFVKQATIDEIFDHFPDKDKLFESLVEMYNEPLQALVEDPEDDEKKVSWTTSW